MNKALIILMLACLAMPTGALAQPDGTQGPQRDRPTDRERDRERPQRPMDRERPGNRPGTQDRPSHGSKHEPITVEQIGEAIETLREMHPDTKLGWLERVETMAEENPEEAARRLSRFPRLRELMAMRENKPDEFELHAKQSRLMRELFPLVHDLRKAQAEDDEDRVAELKGQLRGQIEQLFDVRLKLKEIEIERIRNQLERAEKELTSIKADADELIDQKMNELMQRGDQKRGPREEGDRPDRHERPERPDQDRPKPERGERE